MAGNVIDLDRRADSYAAAEDAQAEAERPAFEAFREEAEALQISELAEKGGETLPANTPLDFASFAINESSESMEERMLADKYVLGRMAIMGQFTVFYAAPNAGKTLITIKLLTERLAAGGIDGRNVFYINADDTYKGLVIKRKLAETYGFSILAPGHNDFKPDMLAEVLRNRVAAGTATECIVILDTLKKFTDLMSKSVSTAFGNVIRAFITSGGTVIGLAHVNKYKNDDGESVYSGTTDIVDDSDCAYIIDVVEDNGA
ncbi:MAG: hypothetical protein DRR42_23210, partial [Gammaproteobacteria bacterium]